MVATIAPHFRFEPMIRFSIRMIGMSVIAGGLLAASGALAQESDRSDRSGGFFDQLFGNSDRMPAPDRGGQQGPRTEYDGPTGQSRAAPSEIGTRMDRLEATLRQLTGTIEQLQFRNQQLEGQVKRIQEDTEYRFQELRAGGAKPAAAPARPAAAPAANQAPPAAPGRRGDAFDPNQNPNAAGAPRTLGSTTGSVALGGGAGPEETLGAPGGRSSTGAPLDLSTLAAASAADPTLNPDSGSRGEPPRGGQQVATLPPSDSPKDNFDLAYGYVLRKDYALAENGFRGFLQRFPNDRLAPDAQFWMGETLFQRQRYRDAAEAFLNVSTKYETAGKAPDALLRLGQSLAALGEKEAACASFGEVLRKYPRAAVGVKQGVEREQKRVRC
jgi:tol-pal system protein YbgF